MADTRFKLVAVDGKPIMSHPESPRTPRDHNGRIAPRSGTPRFSPSVSRPTRLSANSNDTTVLVNDTPVYDKFTRRHSAFSSSNSRLMSRLQSIAKGQQYSTTPSQSQSQIPRPTSGVELSSMNNFPGPSRELITVSKSHLPVKVPERNSLRTSSSHKPSFSSDPDLRSFLFNGASDKARSLRDEIDANKQEIQKLEQLAAVLPGYRQNSASKGMVVRSKDFSVANLTTESEALLRRDFAELKRSSEFTKHQLNRCQQMMVQKDAEIRKLRSNLAKLCNNDAELARLKEENARLQTSYSALAEGRKEHVAKVERDLEAIKFQLEILNKQRQQDSKKLHQLDMRIHRDQLDQSRLFDLQNDMDRIHDRMHAETERIRSTISASDQLILDQMASTEELAKGLPLLKL